MITLKIALRSLSRRKKRMISIAVLVGLGTMLIVFGETFVRSARIRSRAAIVDNFTGDYIVYSDRSQEKPSPFSFQTPLPNIQEIDRVRSTLAALPGVQAVVPMAQNYCIISVGPEGRQTEVPFIFYAVDPATYRQSFENVTIVAGSWLGAGDRRGILISREQNRRYKEFYGVSLAVGDEVTLLGLTEGGSVNAARARVVGIFEPRVYANIFDYINFVDFATYSSLYNFTGVARGSLPASVEQAISATDENAIFALGGAAIASIDVAALRTESLSGYTMLAVRLAPGADLEAARAAVAASGLPVATSRWDEASGGFAQVAAGLQIFVYVAVGLIFLIVVMILMNTMIINILERTGEIGTIRAIGGEKSFVRRLFLAEALLLNGAAGIVGMAAAAGLMLVFGRSGVPLPETVSNYLIGGGSLHLVVTARPFFESVALLLVVSVAATLLPVRVATRVTPLSAMNER